MYINSEMGPALAEILDEARYAHAHMRQKQLGQSLPVSLAKLFPQLP